MASEENTPIPDLQEKRSTGTLARMYLIFTLIPLALMAGVVYFGARALLREQAARHTETYLTAQLNVIDGQIRYKEERLDHLLGSSDFKILTELALHANPTSDEFNQIHSSVLSEFKNLNEEAAPAFDQFLITDSNGQVKVASQAEWEGVSLTGLSFTDQVSADHSSALQFGLSPLYEGELILITIKEYKTPQGSSLGYVIGITEKNNLHELTRSLQAYPLSRTYFVLPDGQFLHADLQSGEFGSIDSLSDSQQDIFATLNRMIAAGDTDPDAVNSGSSSLAQVLWSPALHSGIALELDSNAVYGDVKSLISLILGLIIVLLLVTTLVLLVSRNRLIKSIQEIGNAQAHNANVQQKIKALYKDTVIPSMIPFSEASDSAEETIPVNGNQEAVVARPQAAPASYEELKRLYRSSHLIAQAGNEGEVFRVSEEILRSSPYSVLMLAVRPHQLESVGASSETGESTLHVIPHSVDAEIGEIEKYLLMGSVIVSNRNEIPLALRLFFESIQFTSTAYIPVRKGGTLAAIIALVSKTSILDNVMIQPYEELAELMRITLEKSDTFRMTDRHLHDAESLVSISEAISSSTDLPSFYTALHEKVKQAIGNYSFVVALYEEKTDTISIPYSYENEQFLAIEPFPLGEGLTSILIRSRQPLLLVENTERRAAELGAKIQGKPARSWMGAPMLVQNQPVGALIIQDADREGAFTPDDFALFTNLAMQVAGVINNVRLLDESKRRAIQLETAAEIARDISSSLNLDELLIKAVNLIREQFDFYHAAVFLLDLPGEFAVIREATGEAGTQMKRQGYKIGVGSKSIVGFVTGRGEQLVVNDTAKDSTYYANPLLPDTRAEAAFPLKVGERILGAMDVQSTRPYDFSDDNLRSLQILTDQMAIAVVNTELFAETQEHLSQHRLLHHITTTVASGTTLEEAMESAVNGLQVTLGGDRITIMLVDREKNRLDVKASVGYAEDVTRFQTPVGTGVAGWVAAHKRPLRIRDVSEDPRYIQVSANTRSELAIPLIYRNELLGVLNVESEQVDAYTENDEEMLGTLGGSLAAIIANARLLEQIRMQAERERLIYEVTSKIRRSTDIQSILTTTASELTRVTGSKQTKIKITPLNSNTKQDI
jgi:GAF domain-containing protein